MPLPLSARRANARRGERAAEAAIDAELVHQAAKYVQDQARLRAARAAADEAERTRIRLTRVDVEGAEFVRDEMGWHRVIRVNTKSVTVATAHSWTDRIPLTRVLEVRMPKETP